MKIVKLSRLTFTALTLLGAVLAQAQVLNCVEQPPGSGTFINPVTGQDCITTIQTAVPFLTISPDARSAAM